MTDPSAQQMDRIEARISDLVIRLGLLGLFVYLSLVLIRPFLPILIWSVILAAALAPAHLWLATLLGGRRRLAAFMLTLCALVIVIGPVAALTANLVESVHDIVAASTAGRLRLPEMPVRLGALPVIGTQVQEFWATAATGIEAAVSRYREILAPLGVRLIALVSSFSFDLLKFVLAIVIAGLLLCPGPTLAGGGKRIAARILAPRGEQFVDLAAITVRNVSRGVVGIALLQAILIGLVFQAAGVPSAGLLALIILVLCILQVGPALVVIPALFWIWAGTETLPAVLITVVLVLLTVMDNVLKPIVMGRGISTPTLVIFLGVIGGTLAFGLIGLFVGPVVLAVFYDLVVAWVRYDEALPITDPPP